MVIDVQNLLTINFFSLYINIYIVNKFVLIISGYVWLCLVCCAGIDYLCSKLYIKIVFLHNDHDIQIWSI